MTYQVSAMAMQWQRECVTPKRSRAILAEVTNHHNTQPSAPPTHGSSPTHNLKLLTTVALKETHTHTASQRKEKSLQKLCDRFLKLYPLHGDFTNTEIHLDSTAKHLGVERRRIYDIINILEALQCATHCRKNTYTWHGASKLDKLLDNLRQQGEALGVRCVLKAKGGDVPSPKQRSLGVLAQRFLMMFLVKPPGTMINLEMAIGILISPHSNASLQHDRQHKSKVRRLYDISNVLSSIGLIEKVSGTTIFKKPVFRYTGFSSIGQSSTPPKSSSFQITPVSLPIVDQQTVKHHSNLYRSKRKLQFPSPESPPTPSHPHPLTPNVSPEGPSYKWNEILQVADMEYTRLNGATA